MLVPRTCEDSERESEGPMRPRRRVATAMLEPPLPDRSRHHPHEPERRQSGAGGPKGEGAAPPLISFMLSSSLVISKNTIVLFGEITTERTFSWFSFLKAVIGLFLKALKYITMKEPGLINLQPYYCIITCYLNCCSKLHYYIMPIKENKLQGTKYTVFQ